MPSAVALAAVVVLVPVRADRAEPGFQEFECNNAGQVPALFFACCFFARFFERPHAMPGVRLRRGSRSERRQVLDYCGKTAWKTDFAASSMSSATL